MLDVIVSYGNCCRAAYDETMQYTVDVGHLTYVAREALLRVERSLSSSLYSSTRSSEYFIEYLSTLV